MGKALKKKKENFLGMAKGDIGLGKFSQHTSIFNILKVEKKIQT